MKHKTADLSGDLLDLAVALAEGYQWAPSYATTPQGTRIVWRSRARFTYGRLVVAPPEVHRIDDESYPVELPDGTGAIFGFTRAAWAPSSDWSIGGPIIERERIDLMHFASLNVWGAAPASGDSGFGWNSPTPLVAAMRALVADKLGPEVELPDADGAQ